MKPHPRPRFALTRALAAVANACLAAAVLFILYPVWRAMSASRVTANLGEIEGLFPEVLPEDWNPEGLRPKEHRKSAARILRFFVLALIFQVALAGLFAGPALAQQCMGSLSPASDTNEAGNNHTISAMATTAGNVTVTFQATGTGVESNTSQTSTFTAPTGNANFTFTSTKTGTSTVTGTFSCLAGLEDDTEVATKRWTSATPATMTLEPGSDVNEVGFPHVLTATVTDTFGNLDTGGHNVTFTVVGAGATSTVKTTGVNGSVTFSFTSTQTGSSTITARSQTGTAIATSTKTWEPGPISQIDLVPAAKTNLVSTAHAMTASVMDVFGNAIPTPTVVTFSVIGAGATETTKTSSAGVATFTFSSDQLGVSTITAIAQGPTQTVQSNTATKTWAGLPDSIDLQPASSVNNVGSTHNMTATVTDVSGTLVADGTTVTFTVVGRGATVTTAATVNGSASFTFSSTQAGSSTITATAEGETQTVESNQATKIWANPPTTIQLDPASSTNPVGTTHTMTATVRDPIGQPVSDGTTVTFTVTGKGASVATSTTDNGQATFTFSSNQAGTSTITASAQGETQTIVSNVATKTWIGKAVTITLEPAADRNLVGTTHSMTATAVDAAGSPVLDGSVVTFTVIGRGAGQVTNTTTNGVATFEFTSTQVGSSTITASAQGETQPVSSNQATKTWVGMPATITLSPATDTNIAGSTHTMTAAVKDSAGNTVVDGTPVTFTVSGAGATESVETTTQGVATFTFISIQIGTSTVTASSDGETQTVSSNVATKTWVHGALTTVTVIPSNAQRIEGTVLTFNAIASDSFGNPVANHPATITIEGLGATSATATTDDAGMVTLSFTSSDTGESLITVTVTANGTDGHGTGTAVGNGKVTWTGKRFTSVVPARVLDTRDGTGQGGAAAVIPPDGEIDVQISGQGGVPTSGAEAVIINVTVDQPTSAGFLTVYPDGEPRPVVSNLNFVPNETRPNLASVMLGAGGRLTVFNGSPGNVHVIFDVAGWYSDASEPIAGGSFLALTPDRLLDTRDGTGQATAGAIPAGGTITLTVEGQGGVPGSGVAASVLNVTVDQPQATGFLTVYPADEARPLASNLNFTPGLTIPNLTAIKHSGDGEVAIYNGSSGDVHVVADVYGIYSDPSAGFGGGGHEAMSPVRILDTRDGTGGLSTAIPAGGEITVTVTGVSGIPVPSEVQGVVLNVTVDQPQEPGFLTVYPAGEARPPSSNLNFTPGRPVPNLVMVKVGDGGAVTIFNGSSGTVHVIFDAAGWFVPTL